MASRIPPRACALLKGWREREGLTQEQAAARVGVRQGTLSDWENNKGQPQIAAAVKLEEVSGGAVPVKEWLPLSVCQAASSHAPAVRRKAKRRRGGSGSSGGTPATGARPSQVSKRVRPGGSGAASATEAELLAEMAPEALADAGDRCRVCGCCDVAACPGGCSWVTRELCSSCADLLEQLVSRVSTSGRREAKLVEEVAEAFNEQLQDQAEAYVRKALDDLLGRGVLRREGGRLWRSPPATSRRARPASRRASAEAAP